MAMQLVSPESVYAEAKPNNQRQHLQKKQKLQLLTRHRIAMARFLILMTLPLSALSSWPRRVAM
jgi:hypothetical protein